MNSEKILIFPHAGGNTYQFSSLKSIAKVIEYPGHGRYSMLDLCSSINEIRDFISTQISSEEIWFGHSLGGYLVITMIDWMMANNKVLPKKVYISCSLPLGELKKYFKKFEGKGSELISKLIEQGFLDKKHAENKAYKSYLEKILESDYCVVKDFSENYCGKKIIEILKKTEVIVIAASDDQQIDYKSMLKWKNCAYIDKFMSVQGGHLYYLDQKKVFEEIVLGEVSI